MLNNITNWFGALSNPTKFISIGVLSIVLIAALGWVTSRISEGIRANERAKMWRKLNVANEEEYEKKIEDIQSAYDEIAQREINLDEERAKILSARDALQDERERLAGETQIITSRLEGIDRRLRDVQRQDVSAATDDELVHEFEFIVTRLRQSTAPIN